MRSLQRSNGVFMQKLVEVLGATVQATGHLVAERPFLGNLKCYVAKNVLLEKERSEFMSWSGLKDNKMHGENRTEQNGLLLFVYLFVNFLFI